jgi:PadR family transcriptional regulator PadR
MESTTELELFLLRLVDRGQGNWSWYEIGMRLSNMEAPRSPDMLLVLKRLETRGLVKRIMAMGSPRDKWELTESGKTFLGSQSLDT